MKLNGTLVKSAIVAALGGLVFGFDTAVISWHHQRAHADLRTDSRDCRRNRRQRITGNGFRRHARWFLPAKSTDAATVCESPASFIWSALGCALAWSWVRWWHSANSADWHWRCFRAGSHVYRGNYAFRECGGGW